VFVNQPRGFSLVELMIALTLGMLVLASLGAAFINSSRARDDLERASQQIENGRYAIQVLREELRLAGFWAQLNVATAGLSTPLTKPDPCATDVASLTAALPLQIQGYDNPNAATIALLTCLTDVKANTDIVVVRRASTCVRLAPDCPDVAGAAYFQASLCNNSSELSSPASTDQFRLHTTIASLDRHKKDCATLADLRLVVTRIYYIANNDSPNDGIPTLKRADLTSAAPVSIAQGIENLQLEYGIDTNGDGVPDAMTADPDIYASCVGPACVTNWLNIMSVKINLLARNTSPSSGYIDSKTYTLGMLSDGATANTLSPAGPFKRHVYQSEVRLSNAAGRRE
jgi:type IV pilus assembly protein PilW